MELPVYENDVPVGVLRLERQGLYTVFTARLPPAEGLSRLWLRGGERVFCLGLLEPRAAGRFLCRRLTRLQLASLPPQLDTALALPADAPAPAPPAPAPAPAASVIANQCAHWGGNPSAPSPSSREKTDCRVGLRPPRNDREEGEPAGSAPAAWTRLADGSLLNPACRLLALPCAPGAIPDRARKISLDGREYWLFRT